MAKRILLADDSITIQKVVELTFSDGDYEVTAVNNGNKAVQKLSEMRPDIILSDIIMPEKNGYEVCEYVKSHPEFRSIPVILLTGTFEPFDPDRADKAGCDAVVTKPFESQSLIHKVEELIEAARSQAPTAKAPAVTAPTPADSPFATSPPQPKPATEEFATGTFPSSGEVFATSGSSSRPTTEIPLDEPPTTGATRAFPKMSFEDVPPPPPGTGAGETRAFPKLTFEARLTRTRCRSRRSAMTRN
jgi:CheY-like chemotaxis protein